MHHIYLPQSWSLSVDAFQGANQKHMRLLLVFHHCHGCLIYKKKSQVEALKHLRIEIRENKKLPDRM
jgi:hypothetical protein